MPVRGVRWVTGNLNAFEFVALRPLRRLERSHRIQACRLQVCCDFRSAGSQLRARWMEAMKKGKMVISAAAVIGLSLTGVAQAVCPVCAVAVTTGVGLSRWFGVDDTVTGVWLGGLIVSLIIWSINWMEERHIRFRARALITSASYYLLICIPLYMGGILGHSDNTLLGVDKLALGMVIGSGAFYLGAWWYERLKEKNLGHANFPFQKVVMPVMPLIMLSAIFYFLSRRF
jgi:hypothetical protein